MANKEHIKILEKGSKAWNKWREENPEIKPDLSNLAIYTQNSQICATELKSDKDHSKLITELMNSHKGASLLNINLRWTNLNRTVLIRANLKEADLCKATLQDSDLFGANLQESEIGGANLQRAKLNDVNLQATVLSYTNLNGAVLSYANLQRTWLIQVNLQEAVLLSSKLQGAEILSTKLQGANFSYAIVDGETWIDETVELDRDTNFEGVGLDGMRIDPGIKQLLEYNIRRKKWESWYSRKSGNKLLLWARKCLTLPVRWFWWISNYGLSTSRIIATFFGLAIVFAFIYYLCALAAPPGIVSNLFEGKEGLIPDWLVPVRTVYFSIVTMTTLGFGDMHANCQSFWGHVLLTVEVILGYVLLGALVTRFAILFAAGGPAGRFSVKENEDKRKTPETS